MPNKAETPAQALSRLITERMTKEKLLHSDRAQKFSLSLAAGKVKESDWRLEIESAPWNVTSPRKK